MDNTTATIAEGPCKLVRDRNPERCKAIGIKVEHEEIGDKDRLNKLYRLKVLEELAEIENSNFQDIGEFADLVQVAVSFARMNGFTFDQLFEAIMDKKQRCGKFSNVILKTLDKNNKSNEIYFRDWKARQLLKLMQEEVQNDVRAVTEKLKQQYPQTLEGLNNGEPGHNPEGQAVDKPVEG